MKNRFDVLIFDWDGTLVDSIDWIVHCIQGAASACDCSVPSIENAKSIIGLGLDDSLNKLFPDTDIRTRQQLVSHYQSLFRKKIHSRNDFFSGVYELLGRLRGDGYALAVATGKSRAGLDRALRETGIGNLFSATKCADETASKPDPTMLYQLMNELETTAGSTLMIGDSIHDLQMAKHAEIASIGVACGANSCQQLMQYDPLACLNQTAELESLLL